MIGPLLFNTALMMPMTAVQATNPAKDALTNIFYNPADNMTAVIALCLAIVAFVGLIMYLAKKGYDRCQRPS